MFKKLNPDAKLLIAVATVHVIVPVAVAIAAHVITKKIREA